jgi:hypothetical protein
MTEERDDSDIVTMMMIQVSSEFVMNICYFLGTVDLIMWQLI